jgi:hypothetical protein
MSIRALLKYVRTYVSKFERDRVANKNKKKKENITNFYQIKTVYLIVSE